MTYQNNYTNSLALVVGIDKYANCSPLSNARNDAESIASALQTNLGFKPENIYSLLDENATKVEILRNFHRFRDLCKPDDRVIIFFAGHGHSITGNTKTQGFLVPVDADPSDISSLIRWQELVEGSEMISAKHMLFVMDACFSGLLMQRAVTSGGNRFISDMMQRYTRQAITAGKADQTVGDGVQGGNSTFTQHFLEGLSGLSADSSGIMTAASAMNYAYRKVSQDASSDQTPHYGHLAGDGDMVLKLPNDEPIDSEHIVQHVAETIPDVPEVLMSEPTVDTSQRFFEQANYTDMRAENFGLNSRTEKLLQTHYVPGKANYSAATRFMAVAFAPTGRIDSDPRLLEILKNLRDSTDQSGPPYWNILLPHQTRTTLETVLAYNSNSQGKGLYEEFLCINAGGGIEYATADQAMHHWYPNYDSDELGENKSDPLACWNIVNVIGTFWSSLELARRIYIELGYVAGLNVKLALVGTKGGHLTGFAKGEGLDKKRWIEPLSQKGKFYDLFGRHTCDDENILVSYRATQSDLVGTGSITMVTNLASQICQAFNHQDDYLPCFNWGTTDFPWNQFRATY